MKNKILTFIICGICFMTACEKDGSMLRVLGMDSSELMSSETDVVITDANSSTSVLALTWNESDLHLSDESMGIPSSVPQNIIEVSPTENFDTIIAITPQGSTCAFTGASLNTLGKNLKFTAGESTPMYFRIRSALGNNTEAHYSNTVVVNVTCFSINMSLGFILKSDHQDTGFKLYSPESDGEYYGFTGVTAWYNWFLLEGDGTEWGNLNVDGNPFVLMSDANHWNMWYPGQGGCYYATLSTNTQEWSATYIPTLSVKGDVNGAMTFDRNAVTWYLSFTTASDNQSITVKGEDAKLYNKTTGTDDAAAITKSIGFIPHADSTLTFEWNSSSAGTITVPKAGDYTLTLYLANPTSWKFSLKPGKAVVIEPISKFLYLPGIDDGISGSWTFDNYLKLVSEDDSTFAGAVLVNSLWGYQMGLTSGDWANVYKMGSTEGTLEFKGAANIVAPSPGLYLIQADLKNLTYSHTLITSLSYAGLNDNWTMTTMDETAVPGVYTSTVTINAPSQWGFKLYLNGGWDYWYGGKDGALEFKGQGITDDQTLAAGSYTLNVDIIHNTYSFVSK
jgi:starch-binding outer membrane protein SusE/F